jgi:hypothetical protein
LKRLIFLINILILLPFLGCRNDVPSDSEVKKRMIQYLQSVNLPITIDTITVSFEKYNIKGKYQPVKIYVKGKIFSDDKKSSFHIIKNLYEARFYRIFYSNWEGNFSIERKPPPDSIIYSLSSKFFGFGEDQINILNIDLHDETEKYYPVKISLSQNGTEIIQTIPFFQDEFGIWVIGKSNLINPEGTVREFLSEVNRGYSEKAKRYFSYQYKYGYDDDDKKNLEKLFPKGSINDISFKNNFINGDTANVNLIIAKTDLDTFKTDLTLIKFGYEWRIKYYGWDWKFRK